MAPLLLLLLLLWCVCNTASSGADPTNPPTNAAVLLGLSGGPHSAHILCLVREHRHSTAESGLCGESVRWHPMGPPTCVCRQAGMGSAASSTPVLSAAPSTPYSCTLSNTRVHTPLRADRCCRATEPSRTLLLLLASRRGCGAAACTTNWTARAAAGWAAGWSRSTGACGVVCAVCCAVLCCLLCCAVLCWSSVLLPLLPPPKPTF
jgi:hypothetical protein